MHIDTSCEYAWRKLERIVDEGDVKKTYSEHDCNAYDDCCVCQLTASVSTTFSIFIAPTRYLRRNTRTIKPVMPRREEMKTTLQQQSFGKRGGADDAGDNTIRRYRGSTVPSAGVTTRANEDSSKGRRQPAVIVVLTRRRQWSRFVNYTRSIPLWSFQVVCVGTCSAQS